MSPTVDFFDEFSNDWADLKYLCICWEDKIHKIPDLKNFFTLQESISDDKRFFYKPYYVILRTTYHYESVVEVLYSWFSKLFKIEVTELSWDEVKFYNSQGKGVKDLQAFLVEFNVLRPSLWTTKNLSILVYYSFTLLELLDYKFCPQARHAALNLYDIIFVLFQKNNNILADNMPSFFHRDLADLIITLKDLRRRESSRNWMLLRDIPRFISEDVGGIPFILQSRYDINEVINRVNEYDATKITDEIFAQYKTVRRNF